MSWINSPAELRKASEMQRSDRQLSGIRLPSHDALMRTRMQKENSFNGNLEDLTDTEIYLAIRYLVPDQEGRDVRDNRSMLTVRVVTLTIGVLGLILFYIRSH